MYEPQLDKQRFDGNDSLKKILLQMITVSLVKGRQNCVLNAEPVCEEVQRTGRFSYSISMPNLLVT